MYFGAEAYRKWADDIESGRFEDENLPLWENYGVYVCNLATNGGEPTYIFRKLADINPKYAELANIGEKIQKLLPAESPTGGRSLLWIQLDELDGGMDIGKVKMTMRNKENRSKVAAALRDYAERLDQAVDIMLEMNSANKTSMVGSHEVEAISVSAEKDSIHETNIFLWDTKGNDVIGTTALPMYGAFTSEEKLRLFGDVSGKKALEIGCGTGRSLQYIGERMASELWGLDISEKQIEKASQHLAAYGLSAKFVCSPMEENCGIPEDYFDVVYSVYGVGWTTDLDGTFRRVASYLKKDGIFIFSWSHPIHKCVASENDMLVFKKCYFDESWYSLSLDGGVLTLSDRKLSTYVNALARAGFVIEQMVEESDVQPDDNSDYAQKAKILPVTFVIKARKI
ncbi:MAG: class I SAM-dependent methyltransferase [Oscillospiraceae bacterium]|nr:class I SAM-dependent methyltransferase [Oscillospiraceae bacterium]